VGNEMFSVILQFNAIIYNKKFPNSQTDCFRLFRKNASVATRPSLTDEERVNFPPGFSRRNVFGKLDDVTPEPWKPLSIQEIG
jgi:hypothetical protein